MMLGSPDLCPCGASGCVEVDGIVWLCERCADRVTDEFKRYLVTSGSPDVKASTTNPAPGPMVVDASISEVPGAHSEQAAVAAPTSTADTAAADFFDLPGCIVRDSGNRAALINARQSRVLDAISSFPISVSVASRV